MGFTPLSKLGFFYHENTQNHVEKPSLYFHIRGVARISCLRLSAPVCACLRALVHRQMRWRTGRFGSGHAGLAELNSHGHGN